MVSIPGIDLQVSRFIFGTAGMSRIISDEQRLGLLLAAIDAGFTHFDTAPYYGFGIAERDVGAALRARPHATVTTKVGIHSPGGERQSPRMVFLRKALGKAIPSLVRPTIDFSLERAQKSLDGSLKRLGRDVIDIYTLHEPEIGLLRTDEWLHWLERQVALGKVRHFGLALTADRLEPFLAVNSPLARFVQCADSLDKREADLLERHGLPMQVTYGYVSAAAQGGQPIDVPDILRQATARNREGAIIVSTSRPDRLSQYAALASAHA